MSQQRTRSSTQGDAHQKQSPGHSTTMIAIQRWSKLCPVSLIRRLCITLEGKPPTDNPVIRPAHHPELSDYIAAHERNSNLHIQFWRRNNERFARQLSLFHQMQPRADESIFYRAYMEEHRREFQQYHLQACKSAFYMLFVEYRWMACQLRRYLKTVIGIFVRSVRTARAL